MSGTNDVSPLSSLFCNNLTSGNGIGLSLSLSSPPHPSPHVHTHPSHSHDLHTHVIGGDSAKKSPSSGEIVNSSLTEPTFSIEEELRYARRFEKGYDLPDTKYI